MEHLKRVDQCREANRSSSGCRLASFLHVQVI